MQVLTAARMREIDRVTTERYGVPSLQLMENAGSRVVEVLQECCADLLKRKIVVLCGKGNNGGDGFVVARLLKQLGASPAVLLFASPETVKGDAAVNLGRWREVGGVFGVVIHESQWESTKGTFDQAQLVVDALLGTGLNGPVEGLLRGVISDVNQVCKKALVVSVDIPSGLSSDSAAGAGPAIEADYTVTFTAPKLGQLFPPNSNHVGKLVVRSIGTPAELLAEESASKLRWLEPTEFRNLPLRRQLDLHKGDCGHALIVAGSRGKTGAAALAAWGALRAGAGLVTVATPQNVFPIVAAFLPEIMTEPLVGTDEDTISLRSLEYERFSNLTKGKNVLAIGPGLSMHIETQQFVRTVLAGCSLPTILDADGLNAIAGSADDFRRRPAPALALTPHPGEMARLVGCTTQQVQQQRLEVALTAAARWNAFVVLKGFRTIIATPDGRAFVNSTGNPGMATGGTGDVLTGMLAGLTAQFGVQRWEIVLSFGVYLHGLAGDLAAQDVGEAPLIASDVVAAIPRAYRRVLAALT